MTPPASKPTGTAQLAPPPAALRELLSRADRLLTARDVVESLAGDRSVSEIFLRLSRSALPSRRVGAIADAVPLLGDVLAPRLALLACGTRWYRDVLHNTPLAHPILRHSLATATTAEAVGRETGELATTRAYLVGLLHHLGDAMIHAFDLPRETDSLALTAQLVRDAGASAEVVKLVESYGAAVSGTEPPDDAQLLILAAADAAATSFGYAAPQPCFSPPEWSSRTTYSDSLSRAQRRLGASIEEMMGVVIESGPVMMAYGVTSVTTHSPIVRAEMNEGVSLRDLGPLPVVFSRISDASDPEVLASTLTAGLVEELGVARAWFLHVVDDELLNDGALSSHGNVALPLHDVELPMSELPTHLRTSLLSDRPIILSNVHAQGGLKRLVGATDSTTLFVPVSVNKDILGLLGVELEPGADVVPDLIAAVASHAGLALKAAHLKRLSDKANIDELTGLFNRRGILDKLDVALEQSLQSGQDLAIALIDCDHLKKVNDNFGHLMGDELVRRVSEVVNLSLRAADEIGRYGGDEFLVVLPETSYDEVVMAMERARSKVELAGLASEDGLLLSVSIGAVVRGDVHASREDLLKIADSALYRSKEVGRNAVTVVRASDHAAV